MTDGPYLVSPLGRVTLPLFSPLQLGSLRLLLVADAQSSDAASRMHS